MRNLNWLRLLLWNLHIAANHKKFAKQFCHVKNFSIDQTEVYPLKEYFMTRYYLMEYVWSYPAQYLLALDEFNGFTQ